MLFTDAQFAVILTFALFTFFFYLGYKSEKKSGGLFMLFSGFIFLSFEALCVLLFDNMILVFMTPFGIFIIIMGIMKAFITKESSGQEGTD